MNIVFFGILIFFLPDFLTKLGITSAAEPISELTAKVMSYGDEVIFALIILAAGGFLAWMVHKMLGSALDAIGLDKLPQKFGYEGELKFLGKPLSDMIAYLVMISIIVVTLVQAMNTLGLEEVKAVAQLLENIWGGVILFLVGPLLGAGYRKTRDRQTLRILGKNCVCGDSGSRRRHGVAKR